MNPPITVKIHPTHAARSRILIGILALGVVIAFSVGAIYASGTGEASVDLFSAGGGIVLGAVAMLIAAMRGRMCRCPGCKIWLFRRFKSDAEPTRRFACASCQTTWDTTINSDDD